MIEIDWDARLRAAVAETLRKREAKRQERAEMARRRAAGKATYQAAKLARNRRDGDRR